jgi:hypothetical protein
MPKWFAVHDRITGELRSLGTVVAHLDHLEALGLMATELGTEAPDQHVNRWDPAARAFVARVVKDRLDDVLTDAQFEAFKPVWASMTKAQQTAVKQLLGTLLGPMRYRQDDEPITLG